ncbi:MAG: hypothetical protein JWQ25_2067 [Daejeonella sp.]|nr:hypothetical protein [Daejeonella sp.]
MDKKVPPPLGKNGRTDLKIVLGLIVGVLFIYAISNKGQKSEVIEKKDSDTVATLSLTQRLKNELNSIKTPVKTADYSNDLSSLQMEIVLFSAYAQIIKEADTSAEKSIKALAAKLKSKVIVMQVSEFPKMRRAYVRLAAAKMWENDIYINVSGRRNTIISLTGGLYAANKNIQTSQEAIQEMLVQFRFKSAEYRWYKEAEEFTFYKLNSPRDNEVL